jgi:hypothetical protein
MLNAAISGLFGVGGPVYINGMLAANTGTAVHGFGHSPTPPGTVFAPNDVPSNEGTLVTGSKTVKIMGAIGARLTSSAITCNFPVNLSDLHVPGGSDGGSGDHRRPTSVDYARGSGPGDSHQSGYRTRCTAFSRSNRDRGPAKVICFLTGHPVDVMTGEVLTDGVDFTLPGLIPVEFERNYYSRSHDKQGPLGPGWHHPLDAWVNEKGEDVEVHLPDGGCACMIARAGEIVSGTIWTATRCAAHPAGTA